LPRAPTVRALGFWVPAFWLPGLRVAALEAPALL